MKRILLIEDNLDVRETTAELLELEGYDVISAENGKIGVEKALQYLPDLIVCDVMMPIMDGYEAFEKISNNCKTSHIPFIFLTAKAERSDIRKGMKMGADDYLTKPFQPNELNEAIEVRLKRHDFLRKEFSKDVNGVNDFLNDASKYLDYERISKKYRVKHYEVKDIVFKENKNARYLFFIKSGMIKTYKFTDSGKEFLTGVHNEEKFIGQLSLLHPRGKYLETAEVLHNAEIYEIPKSDFINLLYGTQEVSQKFIEIISNNLIEFQQQLADMAYATVKQRVARTLLSLHNKGVIKDGISEGVDMAREDFAGLVGIATETAIRSLSKLRDQGIIAMGDGRRIIILDKSALEYITEFKD